MNWINIKDAKPEKDCVVWVIHETYYRYHPIFACYNTTEDAFTFGPMNDLLPCVMPLHITHWFELPDFPNKRIRE